MWAGPEHALMKSLGIWLFLVTGSVCAQTIPPAMTALDVQGWMEITNDVFDRAALTGHGESVLQFPDISWHHAQTEHFVIHYEQAIFARKVARLAEFFYGYIAGDLKGVEDLREGRSHIFIFRSEKRWKELLATRKDVDAWTYSLVEGPVMYLQQADNTASSSDVLAHEMTHLVINRFFTGELPLWLNEGLAEFYEEFGYAEYKGIKKSRRTQFHKLANPYPLPELLAATMYPANVEAVDSFYRTSKYLVAFLLLERPADRFVPFLNAMMNGADIPSAMATQYGFSSLDALEREFKKFCN